ncbi:MAG TPA: amidohydrolase family protein [Beijerinckiaceae bacterium]|jgi:predicted TIM-barrel fold metal-dependent hydrolase|nr:amidohydrolase family protein [Beijerinckiaceae bacterium]
MARPIKPPMINPRAPKFKLPPKACDTHFHIYGPEEKFPYKASMYERYYTPTDQCTFEHHQKLQKVTGFERGIIVTGNPNGRYNNDATIDAIKRGNGQLKGVAPLDCLIDQKALERLVEGGIVGYRIRQDVFGSEFRFDAERTANRVRDFNWHVEVHVRTMEESADLIGWLPKLRISYVLDNLAAARPERGVGDPLFQKVLDHLRHAERCWVSLFGFYLLSKQGGPYYSDVIPIVRALVEARPDRVIWGSNWPHAIVNETPDDGDLIDFIPMAIPEADHRQKILVDNPARLYRWED